MNRHFNKYTGYYIFVSAMNTQYAQKRKKEVGRLRYFLETILPTNTISLPSEQTITIINQKILSATNNDELAFAIYESTALLELPSPTTGLNFPHYSTEYHDLLCMIEHINRKLHGRND